MYTTLPTQAFEWNTAIIGTGDRIIPPANQKRAWTKHENTPMGVTEKLIETEIAHYDRETFKTYLEEKWIND